MDSLTAAASPRALDIARTLHKSGRLPALVSHRTRCGRPGCRCNAGELHGPYRVLRWRERGRQRVRYVRAAEVPEVEAFLEEHRRQRRADRAEVLDAVRALQRVEAMLRRLEREHRR